MQPYARWEDVPIEDGWQGLLNVFRKVVHRPLRTERAYVVSFGPIDLAPGESVTIMIPVSREEDTL